MSPESGHYPFRLVIFGKYHFEKPITLFPIVLAALAPPVAVPPSRFSSRDFCDRPRPSSLRGVTSTTRTNKSNPENGTGDAASSGKKIRPGTYCRKRATRGKFRFRGNPYLFRRIEGERERDGKRQGEQYERRIPVTVWIYHVYREF